MMTMMITLTNTEHRCCFKHILCTNSFITSKYPLRLTLLVIPPYKEQFAKGHTAVSGKTGIHSNAV